MNITKTQLIDTLVELMDFEEILRCLDSGDIADEFYSLWSIQDKLFDYMGGYEDYIAEQLKTAYQECLDEQDYQQDKTAYLKEVNN